MKHHTIPLVLLTALAAPVAAGPDDAPAPSTSTPHDAAPATDTSAQESAKAEKRAEAQAELERRQEKALQFVTHYFQHPDINAVPANIRTLSDTGWMRDWRNYAALMGFLAPLFRAHPERAQSWIEGWSDLPDEHLTSLITALWISKIDGADRIMARQIANVTDRWQSAIRNQFDEDPPDIFTDPDPEPFEFEMLWGWYYATGDERCLKRALFFTEDDREEKNVAQAAITSFSYNAGVYPSVRDWCKRQLEKVKTDPDHALPEAPQLEGILEDADYVRDNKEALKLSAFGVPRD